MTQFLIMKPRMLHLGRLKQPILAYQIIALTHAVIHMLFVGPTAIAMCVRQVPIGVSEYNMRKMLFMLPLQVHCEYVTSEAGSVFFFFFLMPFQLDEWSSSTFWIKVHYPT